MESVESKMKCYTALSNVEITTNYSVESGNQITHQVGDTSITTKGEFCYNKSRWRRSHYRF